MEFLLNNDGHNVGFRLTIELDCPDMMNEQAFYEVFKGDLLAAYTFISGGFADHPFNFSEKDSIVKITLL